MQKTKDGRSSGAPLPMQPCRQSLKIFSGIIVQNQTEKKP
jgi:hypothetical protein